jgi:hypothetical protein
MNEKPKNQEEEEELMDLVCWVISKLGPERISEKLKALTPEQRLALATAFHLHRNYDVIDPKGAIIYKKGSRPRAADDDEGADDLEDPGYETFGDSE